MELKLETDWNSKVLHMQALFEERQRSRERVEIVDEVGIARVDEALAIFKAHGHGVPDPSSTASEVAAFGTLFHGVEERVQHDHAHWVNLLSSPSPRGDKKI